VHVHHLTSRLSYPTITEVANLNILIHFCSVTVSIVICLSLLLSPHIGLVLEGN
jgi:hypothetical protein